MKRIWSNWSILLLTVLMCISITGCGTEQAAYLSPSEREKIEAGIFDSLSFTDKGTYFQASFRNDSQYTLADLYFYDVKTDKYVLGVDMLLPGTEVRNFSCNLSRENPAEEVCIQYIIGDYFYSSELNGPVRIVEDTIQLNDFSVQLETANGPLSLDNGAIFDFINGTEIGGLEKTKIYSIKSELENSTGSETTLKLTINGKEEKNFWGWLVLKLFNENGIIADSTGVYFSESSDYQTATFYGIPEGNYRLVIEETE